MSYNTLLRTGFGGGRDYQVARKPKVVLGGGLMMFPDAEDRIRERVNEDVGTSYTEDEFSAPLAFFQLFVNISILFGN